jgi:RNA polymerase sigma-70 factor, ECF subfamily
MRVIDVATVFPGERSTFVNDQTDLDALSFDAFFRTSKKPLVAMAFLLIGNLSTAQDLTQEAFLRTWAHWWRVRTYDDPQAWTRRVLYNLIVSQARRDRTRRAVVDRPRSVPPPDATHLALAAALRSLPENQMRAIVLHDGAGVPVSEVAAEMNVPEGTVKAWLSRGRAAAAQALNSTATEAKEDHAPR